MDPVTLIVGALIAGASAAAKDVGSQALKDAYAGLRNVVIDLYGLTGLAAIEKSPGDAKAVAALECEIAGKPGVDTAPAIAAAEAVQQRLAAEPEEVRQAVRVTIRGIKVKGDVDLGDFVGEGGPVDVSVEGVESTEGGFSLKGVRGGPDPGKR